MTETTTLFAKAQRHLARRDPVLKKLIRLVGPCTLRHNPNRFEVLARSIISQQISTKAALSIGARLEQLLAPQGIQPRKIVRTPVDKLRTAGLSAAKATYLLDLAEKVHCGEVPLDTLHKLPDDEVVARLLPVKGIGRWTAQMFLIFCLGRWDVLPVDDLGLRAGVRRHYELPELPGRSQLQEIGENWRPYRTIATWYMWKSLGFVPQSDG
jgi:DNA-3-methyladenine glycosylase II